MNKQPEALRLADTLEHKYKFVLVERSDRNGDRIVVDANIDSVIFELRRLHEVNQSLLEALKKLAKLGNGDQYGNSEGNMIARAAITKAKGESNEP